jgi:predicted metalloprotease with PDZ domain
MPSRRAAGSAVIALLLAAPAAGQAPREPIVYTLRVTDAASHLLDVEARVPSGGQPALELRMARWSPGFYRVEDYAAKLQALSARVSDGGAPLAIERTRANRWRVQTRGAPSVVVSYRLICDQRSVTTNWVSSDLGVVNGAATFLTLVEPGQRPHEVRLVRPATWKRALTALPPARASEADHYRAPDFDTLVDSPILAGELQVHEFVVDGSRHLLVDAGAPAAWDARRAAADLERFVGAVRSFWGFLPFERYLFLNVFRQGGGGLEHKDSTLLTANAERVVTPEGYRRWLSFAGHEYFHAFNVKRLRPVELGPFDYESEPRTTSLWLSEGVSSYYSELLLARGGLRSADEFLASLSAQIEALQKQPGRLLQTLEQSSFDVWSNSLSGIRPNEQTVSYYVKGQVVGFLLDARIRSASSGAKSLDDFMRVAYRRHAGERGFTADELRAAATDVAGRDLTQFFRKALASTDELDYAEALDWFGLRFAAPREGSPEAARYSLAVRSDATAEQRGNLQALLPQSPLPSRSPGPGR